MDLRAHKQPETNNRQKSKAKLTERNNGKKKNIDKQISAFYTYICMYLCNSIQILRNIV